MYGTNNNNNNNNNITDDADNDYAFATYDSEQDEYEIEMNRIARSIPEPPRKPVRPGQLILLMDLRMLSAFLRDAMQRGVAATPLRQTSQQGTFALFADMQRAATQDIVRYGFLTRFIAFERRIEAEFIAWVWARDDTSDAADAPGLPQFPLVRGLLELALAYTGTLITGSREAIASAFRNMVLSPEPRPLPAAIDAVRAAAMHAGVPEAGGGGGDAADEVLDRALRTYAARDDLDGVRATWWSFGPLGPDPSQAARALQVAARAGNARIVAWLTTDGRVTDARALAFALRDAAKAPFANVSVFELLVDAGARDSNRKTLLDSVRVGNTRNVTWLLGMCAVLWPGRRATPSRPQQQQPDLEEAARPDDDDESSDALRMRMLRPLLAMDWETLQPEETETSRENELACVNTYGFENVAQVDYGMGSSEPLTLLSAAVIAGHEPVVELLIRRGANVRAAKNQALRVASVENEWRIFHMLLYESGTYGEQEAVDIFRAFTG